MKRICVPLLIAALTAAALYAADQLYCKWCGTSSYTNLQQLLASPCSKSPTRKHEAYGGASRRFYVCQYCATESANFTQLVTSACSKSPPQISRRLRRRGKSNLHLQKLRRGIPQFQATGVKPVQQKPGQISRCAVNRINPKSIIPRPAPSMAQGGCSGGKIILNNVVKE